MRVDLNQKVAIVTGGAQGIGQAISQALVDNGARVALLDLNAELAEASAAALRGQGHDCTAFRADVGDAGQMQHVIDDISQTFGGIDILVNNAGINMTGNRKPIHEYPAEDWARILKVDLDGVFFTSKATIPHLIARGAGRIINVASVMGLVPARLQSAYVAAKAAVVNLTKSMALELAPHNILVNAIAPGSTLTEATRKFIYGKDGAYADKAQSLLSHIPLGRPGLPEEMAAAAIFLAAPESSYITGAILPVDGGWIAGFMRDW